MTTVNKLIVVALTSIATLVFSAVQAHATTTITVELRDENGNLFPTAAGENPVYVSCPDGVSMTPPQGTFYVGDSSATINVNPDVTYFCFASSRKGYKQNILPAVTLSSGGTRALTVTYTHLTQSINANLVDQNGAPFLAPQARLSCGNLSDDFAPNSSSHSLLVDSGENSCSISNLSGYMTMPQSFPVSLIEGVDQTITFTVHEMAASLTVNFRDANGNPIVATMDGAPQASCVSDLNGEVIEFSGVASLGQSFTTFDVLGGRTYDCTISPVFQYQGGAVSVAVGTNENKAITYSLGLRAAPLKIKITDANGTPITIPAGSGPVPVNCEDNDDGTNSVAGEIPEGASEVILLTSPGRYTCWAETFAGYRVRNLPKTVFTKNDITAEYAIIADMADSTLTINFFDENGAVLTVPTNPDGNTPQVYCVGSKGYLTKFLTPGDTSTSINLIGGGTYRCSAVGFYGYLDTTTSVSIDVAQSKTISITKPALNANIEVSIVDEAQNPLLSPQTMSADLFSPTRGGTYFSKNIRSGFSSTVVQALGGATYDARVFTGLGFPSTVGSVTAPLSGAASVQVQKLPTDATLTLRLVDSNGAVVSGLRNLQAYFFALSSTLDHSVPVYFVNGVATAKLRGGVPYTVFYNPSGTSPRFYNLLVAGAEKYFFPEQMSRFTAPAGQSSTQDIRVYRADATLTVNSSLGRGWIGIYPKSISTNSFIGADFRKGNTSVTVPIPAGSHYVVYDGGGGAVAERREINVSPGGTVTLSFNPPIADLNVGVTTSSPSGAGGYLQCNAYHDGFSVYNTEGEIEGSPAYVPLTSTYRDWTIACQGWNETTNKMYAGKVSYTMPNPLPQSASDSVNVPLSEKGELFSSKATGSTNSDIVVPVQGASALIAPAGTFDANKVLTLEVTNKASAPETKEITPKTVLKLSAKDANESTSEAKGPVQLQLTLTPSQQVYSYRNTTGYIPFRTTSAARSEEARVGALSSYTIELSKEVFNEGVIVITGDDLGGTPTPETPTSAPRQPKNLRVASKKVGRTHSIVATWANPSDDASSYSVSLIHKGRVIKTVNVSATRRLSATFSHLRAGTFQVRVRAVNAKGRSTAAVKQVILR
ncbi:MAG: hypothetical protein RL326_584 [Pseudomonadota bacterium]|jgi:hypothetical protein